MTRPLREEAGDEGGGTQEPPRQPQNNEQEPGWFASWRAGNDERLSRLEQAKTSDSSESDEDEIVSVEELPDLIEDAGEAAGNVVESTGEALEQARDAAGKFVEEAPFRDHPLFGKMFGNK